MVAKSLLLVGGMLTASSGLAQVGGPSAATTAAPEPGGEAAPGASGQIEEIIVTAQRREQSIQDVPIAVTALNTAAIERNSARDIRDIAAVVPNVNISEVSIGPSMSQIAIRGVNSQDPEKSFDPAVGVFVDGVYLGTSAFNLLDTFDLARIEVLRGPQGTLFGRNTTGGVINAVRTKPTMEFDGRLRAIFGRFHRADFTGVFNMPIIADKVGLKISADSPTDEGIIRNVTPGGPTGAKDRWRLSGALRIRPTSTLDIVLSYDHAEDDSELIPFFPLGISTVSLLPVQVTQTTFPVTPTSPIVAGFGPDPLCVRDPANGCFNPRNFRSASDGPNDQHSRLNAVTGNAELALTDDLTLTGIAGWRKSTEEVVIDFDGVARTVFDARRDQVYEQKSGELRLASSFQGPLNVVAGLFHFRSKYTAEQALKLDLVMVGVPAPLSALYLNGAGDRDDHKSRTTAVFAQADFKIVPEVTLTAGARYTWDRKTVFTRFYGASFAPTARYEVSDPMPTNRPLTDQGGAAKSWSQFTPKLAVNWQPSRDYLVYASFTRGYNAGGFSTRAGTVADVLTPYDPETIDAYEIGAKADLLDGRLRLNAAFFRNDYNDKQEEAITVGPPPTFTSTTVRNVASARFQGVELEATALFGRIFRLDASVGYLDAKYTDYQSVLAAAQFRSTPAQPPGTLIAADFTSLKPRRAPKWTWAILPTATFDAGPGKAILAATVRHTSSLFTEFFNDPRGRIPGNTLVDASATYRFGGDNRDLYTAKLFVNNLTDKRLYASFTNSVVDFGTVSPPRRWGVEFGVKF